MWRVVWYFFGWHRIRMTGASPQWSFNALAEKRVGFRAMEKVDEFTVELTIRARDLAQAKAAAQRSMCDMEVLYSGGLLADFGGLKYRIPFLLALVAVACAVVLLPRFVLFYRVEGNQTVPSAQILRELEELGVGFGTYGPSIKPQWLKNHMLTRIPQLQWLTVTQNGCCATVIVRERPERLPINDRRTPRNVVASRSGILTKVEVLEGNTLCQVGDIVQEGQLLVSAYRQLDRKTQVTGALAEVYARTWRRETVVFPDKTMEKKPTGEEIRSVSLVVGQKRVNIFGNSGIFTPNCDKMTKTYKLTLPGGYAFPLALELTIRTPYAVSWAQTDEAEAGEAMKQWLLSQAQGQMIAGRVEQADWKLERSQGLLRLQGVLQCEEMIARMVDAAVLEYDAYANDGKDDQRGTGGAAH